MDLFTVLVCFPLFTLEATFRTTTVLLNAFLHLLQQSVAVALVHLHAHWN